MCLNASKYRATQEIAERIAAKLVAAGTEAEVRPVKALGDLVGYDAFVIGSAAYAGREYAGVPRSRARSDERRV